MNSAYKNIILVISIAALFLSACASTAVVTPEATQPIAATSTSAPTATPAPTATAIPTMATPTTAPTPTEVLNLASDPRSIIGAWHGTSYNDSYYLTFNADGTCTWAIVKDVPAVSCSYYFNGTDFNITVTEYIKTDLPQCAAPEATYQVELVRASRIRLINVNDDCAMRITFLAGEQAKNP